MTFHPTIWSNIYQNMIHLLDHPTAIFYKILLLKLQCCFGLQNLALRVWLCLFEYLHMPGTSAYPIIAMGILKVCKNYVNSNESSTIINGQNERKFLDSCNFWQFSSLKGKKKCARGQKKLSDSWKAWTSRLNWQNDGKMRAILPYAAFDYFQHLATMWKLDVRWNVEMSIICHFAYISQTFIHKKV